MTNPSQAAIPRYLRVASFYRGLSDRVSNLFLQEIMNKIKCAFLLAALEFIQSCTCRENLKLNDYNAIFKKIIYHKKPVESTN